MRQLLPSRCIRWALQLIGSIIIQGGHLGGEPVAGPAHLIECLTGDPEVTAALHPVMTALAIIPLELPHLVDLLRIIHRPTVHSLQAILRHCHVLDIFYRQHLQLRQLRLLLQRIVENTPSLNPSEPDGEIGHANANILLVARSDEISGTEVPGKLWLLGSHVNVIEPLGVPTAACLVGDIHVAARRGLVVLHLRNVVHSK